jgi:dTDP-4-amino-4,6-dideoxygalactose transaminase
MLDAAFSSWPVFADADPNSQNIAAETVPSVLTPRARALICVHLAGWRCEMGSINALAQLHDLRVI